MINANEIPPITDPLGRYWEQPSRSVIVVDDTHAVMTRKSFSELCEYSCSIPTGVYEGKMWKRREGTVWLLCWFAISELPGNVRIQAREILLVD